VPLKEYSINIQKLLILLNIQRSGETNTTVEILKSIDEPNKLKTEDDLRTLLKRQSVIFLTSKFKKLLMKIVDLGNS